jgi:hypothetical protein
MVRGFGPVKDAAMDAYALSLPEKLAAFRAQPMTLAA